MAEVYLAKAPGAEGVSKFLAIKRILPQYTTNEDFIEMFKAEAKIAININHTNIVPIYEFGSSRQQFYLAMEYVHGKNLRQLINKIKKQNQALPLEHIIYIINEVAKGLDYAHRFIDRTTGKPLNIIHRDMSPQNVMVSYEGEIKIVDFGIAKAESKLEATQAGTLKGKFGYMSPEQAEGLELDYRTDIFSLGIILWEMLANDRLFLANNELNTIKKIRDCHIPSISKINPQVHADLETITNKALARDRSLRYQSASDLHRDLNKFLNKHFHEY
ncbi:MAG: serine/threonine protein kinase, partial [Bdellovibrionales bacterium]|nr:serine/threonine protein kinase [Bdellovibrionales bacterium]